MPERPASRWCDANVRLDDFAIVTWSVPADRLNELLPPGFEADDRGGSGLVSLVAFRDHGFHFRAAPFAKFSCGQVDFRAYVRHDGETGVWSFGTALDSRLASLPKALWRMPWRRTSIRVVAVWTGETCDNWSLDSTGAWGTASVELTGTTAHCHGVGTHAPAGPPSAIDPFVAWYPRTGSSAIGRYSVWHEPLQLEAASTSRAECRLFEELGLIEPGQQPIRAGVQAHVLFDVHTPPSRFRQ
ncbi:MAG: DUF2071 domain-containing protein [Ilumatobacteraceae bacterium]